MAAEDGGRRPGLIADLFARPDRFDFFQAVRLMEGLARERAGRDADRRRGPVGHDEPSREAVTFRVHPALRFPASPIERIADPAPGAQSPEMVVSFFGLIGPSGVLPRHYTELVIQRLREKDSSLRDFLDLFHHRLISLFFRAWEKYRLPILYERAAAAPAPQTPDPVTFGLFCLVGLGTEGLRDRRAVSDEIFLHYSGHFAHFPRSAIALESLLADFVGVPVAIEQLCGRWLDLDSDDQSLIPSRSRPLGRHNLLGVDLVIGERIWDVQSKFRIRIGPIGWRRFRSLMPDGEALRALSQVVRAYVGPALDFDVQPVLKPDEVPPCQIVKGPDDGPYLGWNSWLTAPVRAEPATDAVFQSRGD